MAASEGTKTADVEKYGGGGRSSTDSSRGSTGGSPGRSSPHSVRSLVQIYHGPGALSDAVAQLEIGVDEARLLSPRNAPQSRWYHALANMVLSVIGAAVLAFPWVLSRLGLGLGLVFILFVGGVAFFSAMILAYHHQSKDGTRRGRLRELTEHALGPTGALWLAIVPQHTYLVGQAIVGIIASGESLQVIYTILCDTHSLQCPVLDKYMFILLFTAVCMVFSPAPGIHDLWIMSLVGGVSSVGFMLLSAYNSLELISMNGMSTCGGDLPVGTIHFFLEQLSAIGIVVGAYSLNSMFLEIQATLSTPPSPYVSMRRVLAIGLSIIQSMYLLVGVTGYGALGDCVTDNILNQALNGSSVGPLLVANILFVLEAVGSTQLFTQPVVDEVDLFIAKLAPDNFWVHDHPRALRFITGPLIMLTFGCFAMMFPSLSGVLGLVCSITSVPLTFITPFCIHLSLADRPKGVLRVTERTICTSLVIVGLFLGIMGAFGSGATLFYFKTA